MVELEAGEYLLNAVQELGPVRSNGMGLTAPDWTEITAFASSHGLDLIPWEFRAIRRMCIAYISGLRTGVEALSIPPMERGLENADEV
jgi:hypothetical protein